MRISAGRLRIAKDRFQDGRRLLASGAIAKADLGQIGEEFQARRLALSERRRQALRLRSVLATQTTRLAVHRNLKRALIQEQMHSLAMEDSRLRNEGAAQVLAPRGIIASARAQVGDGVQPDQPLLNKLLGRQAAQSRWTAWTSPC